MGANKNKEEYYGSLDGALVLEGAAERAVREVRAALDKHGF